MNNKCNKNLSYNNDIKLNINKSIIEDNRLSNFIVAYNVLGLINIVIKLSIPMSETMWSLVSKAFMVVLICFMLIGINIVLRRSILQIIVAELTFIGLYCISFLMNNADKSLLISNAMTTLCICIPLMMYIFSIRDISILYKKYLKFSYICILISAISIFSFYDTSTYSMSICSYLLIFIMIQWNEVVKKKKLINITFAIYGLLYITIHGNRGSLLCLVIYIMIILFMNTKKSIKKYVMIILSFSVLIFICIFFNNILSFIEKLMERWNIQSYTLSRLINKSFFESNSRIDLFKYYLNLVRQKPIFGWGVYGGYISSGSGPHNAIIELLLAFGIVIGSLISIIFCAMLITTIFYKGKRTKLSDLTLMYCAINFTMLFVAGEFLLKPNLFIFVILFIRTLKQNNNLKEHKNDIC